MSFPVGIGIVTYNRRDMVAETVDCVRAFTREPDAVMVVADDGSSDGTLDMLRDKRVPVVTGVNMGIAWNKNRALFLLAQMLGCETVVLLEDDTQPNREGWEQPWIEAARSAGHANLAGHWLTEYFESGSGTVGDPIRSTVVSAQCAAYSAIALAYGGYFDPRFRGYGHEHVEHTTRLVRVGYGGTDERSDTSERVVYDLIKGDLTVVDSKSHYVPEQEQHNRRLAQRMMGDDHFRAPWENDREMRQFRAETQRALADGPNRFRIKPPSAQPGPARPAVLDRLLGGL
jgi:glycosyltransferase involved in cell wall biosynthesis